MTTLAFGFGSPADLSIIFIVALIVFGPKKLPEIGRQIGQAMRELRKVTDELTGTAHSVQTEVESIYKPVMFPPTVVENTTSSTIEHSLSQKTYDQEPEVLMAPVVAEKSESDVANNSQPAEVIPSIGTEQKGA